jgi:hypothetical protein
MAIQFVNNVDFNLNQAREFVLENLAADPTAGNIGRLIYNTASSKVKVDNGTAFVDISGDITEVAAGTYLNGGGTTGVVTLNHDLTSRSDTTSSSSPGYSGSFDVVDSVISNTTGHITAINVKTVTLPAAENYTWSAAADAGSTRIIQSGNTIDFTGGTNINTENAGGETRFHLDDSITLAGTLTVNGTGQSSFAGQVTIPTTPIAATDAASKGYVDSVVAGGLIYQGGFDGSTGYVAGTTDYLDSRGTQIAVNKGWTYTVTVAGTFYGENVEVGDVLIAEDNLASGTGSLSDWTTVQNNIDLASLTQVGIGNVNAGTGITVTYSNGTATVSKDQTNQSAKREVLTDVTSGITRTEAGGITAFTLDMSSSTFFGSGASALDVMVEVIGNTVNAGETVYAEIGRSGANMTISFTGSVANSAYQVLLNYVA